MRAFGQCKYTEEELMAIEGSIVDVREALVDSLFDTNSKLDATYFIKQCSGKDHRWLFDPAMLRAKLLEAAGLENRY